MSRVVVRRVAAWAPGCDGPCLASEADWRAWARTPGPVGSEGQPDVPFLAAPMRRRATRLTRLALQAAFDATTEEERGRVRTVFASRHGAIHVAVKILGEIARREPVSPLHFSHSVHNAQAGLFSIAAGNRQASSSIAAEEDSFAHGFLEAVLHLARAPEPPVLLVMADEPLPDNLRHLIEEPPGAYAVGLLLASSGDGTALDFRLEPSAAPRKPRDWPDALEFVRFLYGDASELVIESGRRAWRFRRAHSSQNSK